MSIPAWCVYLALFAIVVLTAYFPVAAAAALAAAALMGVGWMASAGIHPLKDDVNLD